MFFKTKQNIPEGVGFSTFGATHLIWLVAIILLWVAAIITYKRLNTKPRKVMRIVLGSTLVAFEIIKDFVALMVGDLTFDDLPLHLCGINILLIGFDLLKQNKTVRDFLYYFCIPGALLALLFPNWTMLPCLNFSHIHSFLVHALLVMYPLILVFSGEIKPSIKDMPKSLLLLFAMAIPIYFINMLLDTNFMFLMEPETGNPLGLFEKYLSNHLWGFPVLLPIVMFIMYVPILITAKRQQKITNNKADEKQPALSGK